MAQERIIKYLESVGTPVPRRVIANALDMNPKTISRLLKKLMNHKIVSFIYQYDEEIKKKIWFYYILQ